MAELLFPLQFKRQYSGPIDPDMVFTTSAARVAYLTDPLRYAGQIVSCLQTSAVYVLNGSMNAWTAIGSGSGSTNIGSLTGAVPGYSGGDLLGGGAIAYSTSAGGLATNLNFGLVSSMVSDTHPTNWLEVFGGADSGFLFQYMTSAGELDGGYMDAAVFPDGAQIRLRDKSREATIRFTSASPNLEMNYGINVPSGETYNINGVPHTHSTSGLSDVLSSAASNRQALVYTSATNKYAPMNISNIAGAAQGASTGAVYFPVGLAINATSATKFDVGRVDGFFVDNTTDHDNPTVTYKEFNAQTGITATYLASSNLTYVAIDVNGTVIQSPTYFTPQQCRQYIVLGVLVHSNRTSITVINNTPHVAASPVNQLEDLVNSIGNLNISGNIYSANGANLFINKNSGVIFKNGSNFVNDVNNPHILTIGSSTAPSTMRYHLRDGTEYPNTQSVDPGYWDNNGVRTALTGGDLNNFTIQRIYLTQSGLTRIQYGQAVYSTMALALAAIATESFTPDPLLAQNTVLRGLLVVKGNATNLSLSAQATFLNVGKFGGTQELGSIATTDLQLAYNNSLTPEITTNATLGAVSFRVGSDQPNTSAAIEILNTSGTVTASLFGDGTISATDLTIPSMTMGVSAISNVKSAIQMLDKVNIDQMTPSGFTSRTTSDFVYTSATRVVTASPTSGSYELYNRGKYFVKNAATSATHTSAIGQYFFYFNATGTFVCNAVNVPWDFEEAQFTMCYHNPSTSAAFWRGPETIFMEERHGIMMDPETHQEFHNTKGTYVVGAGFAMNGTYVVSNGTGGIADVSYGIDSGTIRDEDLPSTISVLNDNDGVGDQFPVFYKTGASNEWRWYVNNIPMLFSTVGQNAYYNLNTGGTWSLGEITTTNRYYNMYVFAVPFSKASSTYNYRLIWVMGQALYSSTALAQAESVLALDTNGFPFVEMAPLWQITMRYNTAYSVASGKTRIEAVKKIIGTSLSITVGGTVTTHNNLAGRSDPDVHPATSITYGVASNVDAALADLYLNKQNVLTSASVDLSTLITSGSATSGTFLRGDGTWSTTSGWGTIGGGISSTQIAYGVGTNAIGGSASFTFSSATGIVNVKSINTSGIDTTSATISSFATTSGTSSRYVVADYTGKLSTSPGLPTDTVEDFPHVPNGVIQDDIGKYWTKIFDVGASIETITSLCYLGNGIVLAGAGTGAGDGDVYRSTDYGLTWTKIEIGAFVEGVYVSCYIGNGIVLAGTYKASAGGGDVYRSTDYGLTWALIDIDPNIEQILSLCYLSNGIVLAGSGSGLGDGDVYRSTDYGLTWTLVEMGATLSQIYYLCYLGNGIVLAAHGGGADTGDVYRSTDYGLTWTKIEIGAAIERVYGQCYLGNGIVLTGVGINTGDGDVYRSTDYGLTWTVIEMGATLERVQTICYIGNGVVLMGTGETTGDGDLYKSTDYGLTWSLIEMGAGIETVYAICYLGNGIVLVGVGVTAGDGDIYRSTISWNAENANIRLVDSKVNFVTSAIGDVSSAVPTNGQTLVYSSATSKYVPSNGTSINFNEYTEVLMPGMNWTSANSTSAAATIYKIAYGNGIFVAADYNATTSNFLTSPDGVNWTIRPTGINSTFGNIVYGNGIFVAHSTSTTITSQDGITWTQRTHPATNLNCLTYGNGQFVGLAYNTYTVVKSYDGINWSTNTSASPELAQWQSICYGNGAYVAVGYAGAGNRMIRSIDGINWSTITNPSSGQKFRSICYGNGTFVAVTEDGTNRVLTSPDGITWTQRSAAMVASWMSIDYGGGMFTAVATTAGVTNKIMTSPDGITWTQRTAPADNAWSTVCYGDGVFVGGAQTGSGNRIMISGRKKSTENNSFQYVNSTPTFNNGIISTSATLSGLTGTSNAIAKLTSAGVVSRQNVYLDNVTSLAHTTSAVSWDCALYGSAVITTTSGAAAPTITLSNLAVGGKYQLQIIQNASSYKAITLAASGYSIKVPGGTASPLPLTASTNAVDLVSMSVMTANELLVVTSKAFAT